MASGTHVRVEGVRKSYGGVAALADLDLELAPGITGLLGPNGAGKTTLIRILATLLAPSAGEVRVNGWRAANPGDRVEIRRRLGYLPQDLGLYPRFTVFEFVDYLAILKELDDPADRHRRVRAALAAVELEDLAGRKIRTLSGGMRRRVGIAQAIVADPQLLLLDEPTTGLDPEQRMRFRQLIAGLGHPPHGGAVHPPGRGRGRGLHPGGGAVAGPGPVLWHPHRAAPAGRRPGVELAGGRPRARSPPGGPRPAPTGCSALGPRRPPSRCRRPSRTATCWSAPAPGRTRRHDRRRGRIEARHLARSPLLWLGVVLAAAFAAMELLTVWPVLAGDDLLAYRDGFVVAGGALLAGAWLGLRDRATGAADLVAVTPTAPWRLWRARLAGVAVAAAGAFTAVFVAGLAVSAARGGRGVPDLRLLADGALAVVLGGWVGVAVGRLGLAGRSRCWWRRCWSRGSLLVASLPGVTDRRLSVQRLSPVLSFEERSAVFGFLPDAFWPHLGYLARAGPARPASCWSRCRPSAAPKRPPLRPLLAVSLAGVVLVAASGARLVALPDRELVVGPAPSDRVAVGVPLRGARRCSLGPVVCLSPTTAGRGAAPGTRPCRSASTRPTAGAWPASPARPCSRWSGCSPACPASRPVPAWCRWSARVRTWRPAGTARSS